MTLRNTGPPRPPLAGNPAGTGSSQRRTARGALVFAVLIAAHYGAQLQVKSSSASLAARPSRYIRIEDGGLIDEENVRTARETRSHSTSTPSWTNKPGFEHDVFTFARIIFQTDPNAPTSRGWGPKLGWWVDYPDADLNLSWRLQQMTSIRTDPDCRVLRLTDPDLHDYPLLYMEHAGYMELSEAEVAALRSYLASGGTMFVNDFWSSREWNGFAAQIARVLPDQHWVNLTTEHPIFTSVFNLRRPMCQLRIPTMQLWNEDFDPLDPYSVPHRIDRGEGSQTMTVRAIQDARGQIMILAVHNSDLSDGWEREGESSFYFNHFSEKTAYPLGVNILVYLMLH